MFGSTVETAGSWSSHCMAACPIVRSGVSRKRTASTFCTPSISHALGRWRRWSFSANVVSVVYLPSSMPEEWGTRATMLTPFAAAFSMNSRPGCCSSRLWITCMAWSGRLFATQTPSSRQPIAGPRATPIERTVPALRSSSRYSQSASSWSASMRGLCSW